METSYNGWPASPDKSAIDVVSSELFPGGVKAGDVTTVLKYVVEQLHARVEPLVGGWCWGYTYKANVNNPSTLSCHASGTAIDFNAPNHPNGSSGTFTDAQVGTIYAILAEVQGAVDWLHGYDEMHFEIAVDAATLSGIASQLPGDGEPAPIPVPLEDDGMYTYVTVDGQTAQWAVAPGYFFPIPTPEHVSVAQGTGLLAAEATVTNKRGIDVLRDFVLQPNYTGQPSAAQ